MPRNLQLKISGNILKHRDDFTVLFFIIWLSVSLLFDDGFECVQIEHTQLVEIPPAWRAEKVINYLSAVTLASKSLRLIDFGECRVAFIFGVLGIEKFHEY
ncbi:hypothetical protein ACEOHO_003937 [Vibrio vulnificus]|nr:hypothetical protein [Vibrio vulnificus]ELH7804230.1 hypothetical protein [Vibrio vulnificus]